jgi:hypothetical protein
MEFEQIPTVLTQILDKLDYVIGRLDDMPGSAAGKPEDDELMTLGQACKFLDKRPSTIYSLTSERSIPFMKRGNRLYFLKHDLIEWIRTGRCSTSYETEADFERHLEQLRTGKKRKPSSSFEEC